MTTFIIIIIFCFKMFRLFQGMWHVAKSNIPLLNNIKIDLFYYHSHFIDSNMGELVVSTRLDCMIIM